MSKYKNYFDDLIKINPSLSYNLGNRDKKSCSRVTNDLSDDYLSLFYKLSLKYNSPRYLRLKY